MIMTIMMIKISDIGNNYDNNNNITDNKNDDNSDN